VILRWEVLSKRRFFLGSGVLSYMAIRTRSGTTHLERAADVVFLAGLVLMVAASIMFAWEFGQSPAVR